MSTADLLAGLPGPLPFALPALPGYSVRWNEASQGFDVTVPDGAFFYAEHFFNKAWSDRAMAFFQENDAVDWRTVDWRALPPDSPVLDRFVNIRWQQDRLKLYGKSIPLPRLTAWYGDPGRAYTYSGIRSEPNPWNDGLLHLKRRVQAGAGTTFNSVLLNWYRDGGDYLGWHADDEKELGPDPIIGSANFGETRDFQLRRNDDKEQVITVPLRHGTLLVMKGGLQQHWNHHVPKRAKVSRSRFNLTFRTIHG